MDSEELSDKRPRDEFTESVIQDAIKEMEAAKKAKKASVAGPVKMQKKTLEEIEDEEGGPVRESQIGMAQTKRALNRKTDKPIADESTEVDVDLKSYEQKLENDEEDGQIFEAFNLEAERDGGFFDAAGNYVENKDKDDQDAWLGSEEAKVWRRMFCPALSISNLGISAYRPHFMLLVMEGRGKAWVV
jgi:CD2 antigen cytoplasmic tail-binding protein 2